jgi:hypothetical protein
MRPFDAQQHDSRRPENALVGCPIRRDNLAFDQQPQQAFSHDLNGGQRRQRDQQRRARRPQRLTDSFVRDGRPHFTSARTASPTKIKSVAAIGSQLV